MNDRLWALRAGAALMALGLLFHVGRAEGASVAVALPDAVGAPDTEIDVPVTVRNAEGLGPFQFDLLFDPAVLAPTDVSGDERVGLIDHNLVEPGRLRVAASGQPGQPIQGEATLVTVRFTVAGAVGDHSSLDFEDFRAWEQSTEALDMLVTVESGSIAVQEPGLEWWMILIGALALLVAGALAMVVRKRRPHGAPPSGRTTMTAQAHFCSHCGTALSAGAAFCSKCGKEVA